MPDKQINLDILHTLDSLSSEEKRRFQGATVLITGACGFLGYYFLRFFQKTGQELGIKKVIALDNFMLGKPPWVEEIQKDNLFALDTFNVITDDIGSIPDAEHADLIIHMASIASPIFYRKHPIETLDANIWGLRRLFDYYKDRKIRGLLFFSSSEIYGNPDSDYIPTEESYNGNVSATGPRACYDESKRFGETMCMLFSQEYGMPIGVARPFNNYGPGMRINDKRVPADFALNVLQGNDIEILSDGGPTRTFCYIADAAAGYLKILLHGKYDYFNIGIQDPEITITRLAEIYVEAGREIIGYNGRVIYSLSDDVHYLTDNPQRRCPSIAKAQKILAYNPSIKVEDGVARFLRYLQQSDEAEYNW